MNAFNLVLARIEYLEQRRDLELNPVFQAETERLIEEQYSYLDQIDSDLQKGFNHVGTDAQEG